MAEAESLSDNALFRALRSGLHSEDPTEMSELWRQVVREQLRVLVPRAAVARRLRIASPRHLRAYVLVPVTDDARSFTTLARRRDCVAFSGEGSAATDADVDAFAAESGVLGLEAAFASVRVSGEEVVFTRTVRSRVRRPRLRRQDTDPLHVISTQRRAAEDSEQEPATTGDDCDEGKEDEVRMQVREEVRTLRVVCKETWYDEGSDEGVKVIVVDQAVVGELDDGVDGRHPDDIGNGDSKSSSRTAADASPPSVPELRNAQECELFLLELLSPASSAADESRAPQRRRQQQQQQQAHHSSPHRWHHPEPQQPYQHQNSRVWRGLALDRGGVASPASRSMQLSVPGAGLRDPQLKSVCEALDHVNRQLQTFNKTAALARELLPKTAQTLGEHETSLATAICRPRGWASNKPETASMVDAVLLAVESYVMCGVHDKIFISMTEMCKQEDELLCTFLTDMGSMSWSSPVQPLADYSPTKGATSKHRAESPGLDLEMQNLMKVAGVPEDVHCDISGAAAALGGLSGCCCPLEKLNCLQLSSQCIHDAVNRAVQHRKTHNRRQARGAHKQLLRHAQQGYVNEFAKLILTEHEAAKGKDKSTRKGDDKQVALSMDELLPLFIAALIKARPQHLETDLLYINTFHMRDLSKSEHGFHFRNLEAAVAYLRSRLESGEAARMKAIQEDMPSPSTSSPPYRRPFSTSGGSQTPSSIGMANFTQAWRQLGQATGDEELSITPSTPTSVGGSDMEGSHALDPLGAACDVGERSASPDEGLEEVSRQLEMPFHSARSTPLHSPLSAYSPGAQHGPTETLEAGGRGSHIRPTQAPVVMELQKSVDGSASNDQKFLNRLRARANNYTDF